MARAKGCVKRSDFTDQHLRRPSIRDDVVHGEQQQVVLRRETDQAAAERRRSTEIKALGRMVSASAARLGGLRFLRKMREIQQFEAIWLQRVDNLQPATIHRLEPGAQDFVA